jgi:plastocyanin
MILHRRQDREKLAPMRKSVLVLVAAAGVAVGAFPALAATTHEVAVGEDNSFTPAQVSIAVGDSVHWTRGGPGNAHNIKFDDGSFTEPPKPTPGPIDVTRTFTQAGTFHYRCALHTSLTGTVVVGDGGGPTTTTTTTTTPTPTPTPTPGGGESAPAAAEASGLVVRKVVKAGRVRGSLRAGPAGARLTVRVRVAGRIVGTSSRELASAGTTTFAVKLNRSARRRLARSGRLKVAVIAQVTSGDTVATQARTARLR